MNSYVRFKLLDIDCSGELSLQELMDQGMFDSEEELQKLIEVYDMDQSGSIDVHEFVKIMTPFAYDQPDAYRVDAALSALNSSIISNA